MVLCCLKKTDIQSLSGSSYASAYPPFFGRSAPIIAFFISLSFLKAFRFAHFDFFANATLKTAADANSCLRVEVASGDLDPVFLEVSLNLTL